MKLNTEILHNRTEITGAQEYLQSRLNFLNLSALPPMSENIQASVVVPIYGEDLEDVINLLYCLATQQNIDLHAVEVICVINSPNSPHAFEDFNNEVDYQRHLETYQVSKELNKQVSEFLNWLKTSDFSKLNLDEDIQEKVAKIIQSGIVVHEYNVDNYRLPNEMSSLGGARDIGLAGVVYRLISSTTTFERLHNHIVIQTDIDGILPTDFIQRHISHYKNEKQTTTHAVLGEVDINSDDPNVRILGLQARLKNRARFSGFYGYAHNTNLGAQNAATGCNLSYRVLSAIKVGGIPHDKNLDDWRFVSKLDLHRGTFLDKNICVKTSPRSSARAIGGYGSSKLDYLRVPNFEAEKGAYHDVLPAVCAAYILNRITGWYRQEDRGNIDEFLNSLENYTITLKSEILSSIKRALEEHDMLEEVLKDPEVDAIRRTMWSSSENPITFDKFLINLVTSVYLIDDQLAGSVKEYINVYFGDDVPIFISKDNFNEFMDGLMSIKN